MRERLLKVKILPLISENSKNSQTVKVLKGNHLTENSRNSGKQNFQGEILENLGLSDKVVPFSRKFNIIAKNVPFPAYVEFQNFLLRWGGGGGLLLPVECYSSKARVYKTFVSNLFETWLL